MPFDSELQTRGRLVRSLGALREMLPGSFADGKPEHMHPQFLLSVLREGKPKTFHIPAHLADEARRQVEFHKRFQRAAEAICHINLRRLLRRKQESKGQEKGE